MTIPLFSADQIPPASPSPITALRRMEEQLAALKAKIAATEDPTDDCRCWEAGRLEMDPDDYEELYNEAQAYRAMEREIHALEVIKLPAAQEAALGAVRRAKE